MKILAGVYNPIAYDGRVQRACEALAKIAEVELMCPDGPAVPEGLPFGVRAVELPIGRWGKVRRHLAFWWAFIAHACGMRPDVVYAHDFFMAAPGVVAMLLSGTQLIYDAHELIIPEPNERLGRRSRFWYFTERWALRRADLVIAANEERARLMAKHYKLRKTPLVIRNIPSKPSNAQPSEVPEIARSTGKRVCVYQGDVNLARGLGRFLEAMPLLPEAIQLLIVGGGPDEVRIKAEVERMGIQERVTILSRVPREQLAGILRTCDVGLISYSYRGLNNIYCAPNKIFEYVQAGLPVVTTNQPPLSRMVTTYRLGKTVAEHDHPQQVAEAILRVVDRRASYKSALKRFLRENCWENEAMQLTGEVKRMLEANESRS